MRKLYTITSLVLIFTLFSTLFFSTINAQSADCTIAQIKLNTLSDNYESVKNRATDGYSKTITSLKDLANRLTAKGYGTTQIVSDIQNLQVKVDKFGTAAGTFTISVKGLKNSVCSGTGTFKSDVQNARTQLVDVRSTMQDILNYFQTVIKGDLRDLKTQKAVATTTVVTTQKKSN